MSKFLQRGNSKWLAYVIYCAILFGIWRGMEFSVQRLQLVPVKSMRAVQSTIVKTDTKAFYPVLLKQSSVLKAETAAQQSADLDALFKTKVEAKKEDLEPPKPPEPNYRELVRQRLSVDGVASNGAVINGRFYHTGERMEEFSVSRPNGIAIVPVLLSAAKERVEIGVDKEVLSVQMNVGSL